MCQIVCEEGLCTKFIRFRTEALNRSLMACQPFQEQREIEVNKLRNYVFSEKAFWFWLMLFFLLAGLTTRLVISEKNYPLVYIRNFFGLIFVLWLPGYGLFRVFFYSKKKGFLETVVFSVGLSIAIVYLVGLLLNYSPWRLQTIPMTLSLFLSTFLFSTIALLLEFRFAKKVERENASLSSSRDY